MSDVPDASQVLSASQQQELDDKKVQLRLSNEKYLRNHPEVKKMTTAFMHKVLAEKPDNVLMFAQAFFTSDDLGSVAAHK